ncbi:hypothetical protein C4D60_Mb06t34800 [Musa balbisiana]|uniref:Uncharacterized protein n=1 Tax=Musa balbisiana TaxID=52838 RepID=A0A4V6T459_MUSBA|nr:hypothetical protein C4D60_Mb06t34800 [Musa balbisiana]
MEEGYTSLPASHLLGSVPAVIAEDKTTSIASEGIDAVYYYEFLFGIINIRAKVTVSETKSGYLGLFFDSWSDFNAAASTANLHLFPPSNGGYQAPGTPSGADEQTTSSWQGVFSISSYSSYFNVDTDVVVERIISSVYPMNDFYRKIDGNPDLGVAATWLAWPGLKLLLVVPVELFRWIIIIVAGTASSWFIAVNLKAYTQSGDLMILIVGAMVLQFALALFIKMFFFP